MKKVATVIAILMMLTLCASFVYAQQEDKALNEQPVLITSAGQSADVKLVGMLAKQQKIDAKIVEMAKPADLEGIKTLIIVPGFSSKGLGAAGVSQKDELDRVVALLAAATEKKVAVVMIHIGGTARRGGQSDDFCKLAANASAHMIVVAQGDEDKLFTNIAAANKAPLEIVGKIAEVGVPLGALFKK
jgi:hypothetical protein